MKKYNAPKVKESKAVQILTTVWLVPFLAMIIALWLAFQYYAKIGPTISISFKSNAGLIANQSQIKLRDVTVGMVTKISLSKDGKGVTVEARMNKEVSDYLNGKAKLWIVHADVGSHGISGLDTLVSGSYIELHGVKESKKEYNFVGMEKAKQQYVFEGLEEPFIDSEAEGKYYLLSAPNSYNISEGSNIYYRMIKVGRVERVGISPDGKQVNFTIFVKDRCANFINSKSQFYSRSNFEMDFSQGKMDFSIASLSQIIHGGISIYTPVQTIQTHNEPSKLQGKIFPLYKSLTEMKEKHLMTGLENKIYKFKFKDEINKLQVGSPLEFNGFQIGYVTEIESQYNEKTNNIDSEVFAIVYTNAFAKKENNITGDMVLSKLVEQGLKAKLDSAVPMIGGQFINFIFDTKQRANIEISNKYALFPTVQQGKSNNILSEAEKVLKKLEKLPLEKLLLSATKLIDSNRKPINDLVSNLDKTIKNFNKTVNNLNKFTKSDALQELPTNIRSAVIELENTLAQFQTFTEGYNANSQFSSQLSATLKELSSAAESIERVSRKLEKKPNSLLLGDD